MALGFGAEASPADGFVRLMIMVDFGLTVWDVLLPLNPSSTTLQKPKSKTLNLNPQP